MSHRPLVFVLGLTVGDYLLWNWSLNANHDVLALASGLTLPPLVVACIWLLALSVGRVLAGAARRRTVRELKPSRRRARGSTAAGAPPVEPQTTAAASSSASAGKIAA